MDGEHGIWNICIIFWRLFSLNQTRQEFYQSLIATYNKSIPRVTSSGNNSFFDYEKRNFWIPTFMKFNNQPVMHDNFHFGIKFNRDFTFEFSLPLWPEITIGWLHGVRSFSKRVSETLPRLKILETIANQEAEGWKADKGEELARLDTPVKSQRSVK